jgi:hypothetical protein
VFDFGKTPVGGEMVLSGVNLFSIFGYGSDTVNALRWGIIGLVAADGTVAVNALDNTKELATTLADSTYVTRNNTHAFYQQGFIADANAANHALYSCLIYQANETHDEIALTQHSSETLNANMNLEFSRGYLPLEACHIAMPHGSSNLVMAVGTFEYTHIFGFEVLPSGMSNVTHLGLAYYHQRYNPLKIQMFENIHPTQKYFTLYIRTNGFDVNDDKLFITTFYNLTGPAWDNPCTASEIQFDTTSTFFLSLNDPNGVGVNEMSKWTSIDFAFKQVSNLTIDNYYLGNPQKFQETVVA